MTIEASKIKVGTTFFDKDGYNIEVTEITKLKNGDSLVKTRNYWRNKLMTGNLVRGGEQLLADFIYKMGDREYKHPENENIMEEQA